MKITLSVKALAVVVLWVSFILTATVFADSLSIGQFGGYDRSINDLNLPVGMATGASNWDLSKGTLIKRDGYALVLDMDSTLRGVYGFMNRNGVKRLLTYKAIDDVLYDGLFISDSFSYSTANSPSMLLRYKNATPLWVQYNDNVVIANGYNRPVRYNETNFKPLVEVRPGQLKVDPLNHRRDDSVLNGTYYYAWRVVQPCSVWNSGAYGPLTGPSYPVHVDSGGVQISGFNKIGFTDICGDPDTIRIQVGRTRANRTPSDSFFAIHASVLIATHDFIGSDNLYWADMVRDDSLIDSSGSTYGFIGFLDTTSYVADSTTDSMYRPGQPQWLGTDTCADNQENKGLSLNEIDSLTNYWRYFIAWYDSSTGMVSDSGPTLRVPTHSADDGDAERAADGLIDSIIRLSVPPTSNEYDYCWRILYRGLERSILGDPPDSVKNQYTYTPYPDATFPDIYPNGHCADGDYMAITEGQALCWRGGQAIYDSLARYDKVGPFYPVDTIKSGTDSIYSDIIPWTALQLRDPWYNYFSPGQSNYPVIHDNRLYLADGSWVYFSDPFNTVRFPSGNTFSISPDDGDEITGFLSTESGLLVFKNKSTWRVRYNAELEVHTATKIRNIGCIAPHSIITLPQGGYAFLSDVGVQAYSTHYQSMYKTSGGNFGTISKQIKVYLDAYGKDTLRNCHTWLTDDYENLVFSFPDLNTSWVYALATGQWNTWSFAARQTTRYDTTYQTNLSPSSDVLFCKESTDSLFKFGGVKTDNELATTAIWTSGPLFQTKDWGQIYEFGTWKTSDVEKAMSFRLQDQADTTIDLINDSVSVQYRRYEINPEEAQYYKIYITVGSTIDSVEIKRVDLWWQKTTDAIRH